MNKAIVYVRENWLAIIAIILFTYIILFDLTIDCTYLSKDASSKTEFHYVAPFKF